MENFFYEGTNRAQYDAPYVDTGLTDIQYGAHFHEEIEIVYMIDGVVHLVVEGKCMVLQQGDLALVRPFQIHSLATPTRSKMYLFKILSPFFDFSAVERANAMLTPGDPEYAAIYESVQMLIREHALPDDVPLKRLALRSATDQLLVQLARLPGVHPIQRERERTVAHDRDIELLKVLNDYLADHYQEPISLEAAAGVCHMSLYYFAHFFKRTTGTTFLQYLNGYRLEKARVRLIQTEFSVTAIAMQCGFPSIRTFNRCFRKQYAMSPTAAREKWKKERQG